MTAKIKKSHFMQIFSVLPDPRKIRNRRGYGDWEDVSLWTQGQLSWLQSVGICLNGAPSHDTYNRFFRFFHKRRNVEFSATS